MKQKKVGVLAKEAPSGPFIEEWKKAFGDISKDVEEVDIAPALSIAALAVKDETELVCPRPYPGCLICLTHAAKHAGLRARQYWHHVRILR